MYFFCTWIFKGDASWKMVAGNHHHDKTQVGPEKQDDDERAAAANTAATQGARDTEEDELIKVCLFQKKILLRNNTETLSI